MIDKGVVSTELITLLLSEVAFNPESIVALMVKFGLIVPILSMSSSRIEYLVSSIIHPMPTDGSFDHVVQQEWDHHGFFIFTTDESFNFFKQQ